jgi:hypothetical protein
MSDSATAILTLPLCESGIQKRLHDLANSQDDWINSPTAVIEAKPRGDQPQHTRQGKHV